MLTSVEFITASDFSGYFFISIFHLSSQNCRPCRSTINSCKSSNTEAYWEFIPAMQRFLLECILFQVQAKGPFLAKLEITFIFWRQESSFKHICSANWRVGSRESCTVGRWPCWVCKSSRVDQATFTVMALMEIVKQLILELFASLQHEDGSAEGSSHLQQALSQWRSKLLSHCSHHCDKNVTQGSSLYQCFNF